MLIPIAMSYTRNVYINIIHQISSSQALHTSQHLYIQETRKIDTKFHSIYKKLPTQNKMESKYYIMVSINQDKQ